METNASTRSQESDFSPLKLGSLSGTFKRRIPNFFSQYKLLLWKTLLLRIREPWVILAELLLPILIIIVVVGLRFVQLPKSYPHCYLASQPLPSMGFLNYMRGLICNFNFTCSPHDVDDQSQATVVPELLQYLGKEPELLHDLPHLVKTFADKGEHSLFKQSWFSDFICQKPILNFSSAFLPTRVTLNLNSFCSISSEFRQFILPLVFGDSLLAALNGTLISSQMYRPINRENYEEKIKNVSLLVCGNQASTNSFLSIFTLKETSMGGMLLKGTLSHFDDIAKNNASACSILKSLFNTKTFRPWTTRLRTALQGEIFYYPFTKQTEEVMRRANTTAVMLEKLQKIFTDLVPSTETVLPEIFVDSTISKALRALAKSCFSNQALAGQFRENCLHLIKFLEPTPSSNYSHWTELLPLIGQISGAMLDILDNCVVYDRFHGFSEEAKMFEAYKAAIDQNRTAMILQFNESKELLSIQFRLQPEIIDSTYRFKVLSKHWTPEPRVDVLSSMKYFTSGFIDIQDQVERAYITLVTNTSPKADPYDEDFLPNEMQFVPAPCYEIDPMSRLFYPNLPLLIVVIWLCNYVINVRAIVYEKEIRLKEYTKVMGMGNSVHWLNWLTIGFVMMASSSIIDTLLLKYGHIYPRTDGFLLFCCLAAYILAILPQAFMTSVFFTNANFGAVFSGIFYFIMYVPYNLTLIYDLDFALLFILTFSPQCAIAMAFSQVSALETQRSGAQWYNLWTDELFNVPISPGLCLLMLLVDGILAWIGVWYFENVAPTAYGLTRKWYFPFTRSYWAEVIYGYVIAPRTDEEVEPMPADLDMAFHEPPDGNLNVGVSIRGLSKVFGREKFCAVNNMWVDFYENQITAFLGHNGAGKTTTISILTGILPPSAGTAYVYGKSINYEMSEIRHNLGLCPQHNVLFDNLTVTEHILFFGYLKGLTKEEVKEEVSQFLVKLGLETKANELSKNLSGGQKRRLSLAAAFVGGSKMVFLDEPTAGVDPSSRRTIWNLIFRFKASRTIILTTHHMDEADVLGDRITIVSQGRVKASGSSLFLKSKFAKYYYLSMEKSEAVARDTVMDKKLAKFISARLTGSELSTSTPTEWVFTLPAAKAYDKEGFVQLFAYLEAKKDVMLQKFGVKTIGLTDTSLEEIFILISDDPSKMKTVSPITRKKLAFIRKLFQLHHREPAKTDFISNTSSNTSSTDADDDAEASDIDAEIELSSEHEPTSVFPPEAITVRRNTGCRLYLQQCRAYIAKRKQIIRRDIRGWILEMVIPAITVIILMIVVATYPVDMSQPNMPLHPWLMSSRRDIPHLQTFFSKTHINNTKIKSISNAYSREIASARGWSGTRCLPHSVYKIVPEKYAFCNLDGYTVPDPLPSLKPEEIKEMQASEMVNCSCNSGEFSCPSKIMSPPSHLLPTTDYLFNLTHYNVSNYLLKSRDEAILKRYGGLSFMVTENGAAVVNSKRLLSNKTLVESFMKLLTNNSATVNIGLKIADFVLDALPPTHYARIWYHNKGFAASTAYLNVLHNLQLRMLLAKGKLVPDPENHGIASFNHPLPSKAGLFDRGFVITLLLELVKTIGVVFALSFVAASFSTFIIRERKCGAMEMQILAGQSRAVYWLMSYLWDFVSFFVPITIILIVFAIFNEQAYISRQQVGAFIALMLAYGLAITPLMYCFTFFFNVPSVAFVSLLAINIVVAIITSVIVYTLELFSYDNSELKVAVSVLEKVFLIFPQFAFCRGFYQMAKHYTASEFGLENWLGAKNLYEWGVLADKLVVLVIEAVVCFGIVFLISYTKKDYLCERLINRRRKKVQMVTEDALYDKSMANIGEDVLAEIARVENDPLNEMVDVVRVINLTKYYGKKKEPAVNNLTFGVRPGECFGLLGVNGAGKTTTFSMLTTTIRPTSGTILIGDQNITRTSQLNSHGLIGYCPQFDALLSHLTGFETLQLFARIHGYPESVISILANRLIDRMSLRPHANKPVHTYSGGNLRKLSTAVATIGHPQVLLLDEPTSGMDPGAKRCLWDVIKSLQQEGCSVVLTTHSMEECEALCNRLAIMMDGQFQCFGTVAYLKQRFGEGYILEVDLSQNERNPQTLFPPSCDISLTDSVGKKCNFEARGHVSLSKIFQQLLALHSKGVITNFAVRQVSLDSVFVNFVRSYGKNKDDDDYQIEDYGRSHIF